MGPLILEKNKIDLDFSNVTITPTDGVASDPGTDFVNLLRNRRNDSGWGTAGSSDAGLTTLTVEMTDEHECTDLFLVDMNFKAYTVKYWNGSAYVDFSVPIAETTNTLTTKHHQFAAVSFSRFQIIIQGTMTADQDKLMAQLIITRRLGQFTTEPYIKKPKIEKGRKVRKMLSGRSNVTRSLGAFSCAFAFPGMTDVTDHALIEAMFDSFNGFLVWLRGDQTNASLFTDVQGFRTKDLYLMTCANDLETEWNGGYFKHGQKIEITLVESRI